VEPLRNLVINEFLAHTDAPLVDFIELYNHSSQSVDAGGAWLTDNPATNKFRIPSPTIIPPRGFLSFDQTQLGFSLSSAGERILLVNSNQTRVLDALDFGPQANGISSGRYPDGAPLFQELAQPTGGEANAPALAREIVINEIMYHPISENSDDEYLELYNRGGVAVNLGGWRFTDGISFRFPSNTMIAAGGYLVVARNRQTCSRVIQTSPPILPLSLAITTATSPTTANDSPSRGRKSPSMPMIRRTSPLTLSMSSSTNSSTATGEPGAFGRTAAAAASS
jgi:hypothetical protein